MALHLQFKGRSPPHPAPAGEPSDLTRLLDAEGQLEEMLRRTREEAARLVAAAQVEAVAREAAFAAQLEADARGLEEALEAEYRRRAADTAAEDGREAERFNRIEADRVAALARYVVSRVIGGGGRGAGP